MQEWQQLPDCLIFVISANCSFQDSEVEGLLNKFVFCAYIYTGKEFVTLIGMRLWNIAAVDTIVGLFLK